MRAAFNTTATIRGGPQGLATDPILAANVPCRFVPKTDIEFTDAPLSFSIAWITMPFNAPGGRAVTTAGNTMFLDYGGASTIVLADNPAITYYVVFTERSVSDDQAIYYRAHVALSPLVAGV